MLVEPFGSAELRLKITVLHNVVLSHGTAGLTWAMLLSMITFSYCNPMIDFLIPGSRVKKFFIPVFFFSDKAYLTDFH